MFSREKAQQIANELGGGVTAPDILAVAEVESGGRKDLPDGRPQILFEAQWFHNFTDGQYDLSHPNVSSPTWNKALYKGGVREYDRLAEAVALNETAALKSASWGLFQIMGFNYKAAGFPTVQMFVEAIKDDDDADMAAFIGFVRGNPTMLHALRTQDDRTFALHYNGPGQVDYYANEIRIARAHYQGGATAVPSNGILRQGMSGREVMALQLALGFDPIDGVFGPKTEAAVKAIQSERGLEPDGFVGPLTKAALGLT